MIRIWLGTNLEMSDKIYFKTSFFFFFPPEWSWSEEKISHDILYVQYLKRNYTNELIHKTDSQITEWIYGLHGGRIGRRDSYGVWDRHSHTAIFRVDNQQVPTVQHRELRLMLRGSLSGSWAWGRMDTCICMAEPFAVRLKLPQYC